MKKTFSILVLFCVLLLSACGNNADSAPPSSITNGPSASHGAEGMVNTVQAPVNQSQAISLRLVSMADTGGTGENAQGYYESIESGMDDGSRHIVITDYASATRRLLCADQNCAHNGPACISWLPRSTMPQHLFTHPKDNTLFYIGNIIAEDDSKLVGIYAYGADGGSRREICRFAVGEFVEGRIAADDTHLYVHTFMEDAASGNMKEEIRKIDIDSGDASIVTEISDGDWLAGTFGDRLVIGKFDGTTVTYLLQSVYANEQTEVFSYSNSDDIYVELLGEKLFVLRKSEETKGDVTLVDLSTGEETALYSGFPFFGRDAVHLTGIYNDIAVFNTYDNRRPDAIVEYCYAVRLGTFDVSEITLTYQSHADTLPLWVVADAGNSLLVVTGRGESGTRSVTGNDGTAYDIPVEYMERALISKVDYLANRPNYIAVADTVMG